MGQKTAYGVSVRKREVTSLLVRPGVDGKYIYINSKMNLGPIK